MAVRFNYNTQNVNYHSKSNAVAGAGNKSKASELFSVKNNNKTNRPEQSYTPRQTKKLSITPSQIKNQHHAAFKGIR